MLILRDKQNEASPPAYLVLTGLSDTTATLRAGEASHKVSVEALRKRFQGEFVSLWREPRAYRGTLAIGDRGADVDWVAAQLAQLNSEPVPAAGKPFDDKLAQQLRDFQTARGLKADGVVGPLTLMHLNQAAGMNEPRLRGEPLE
jgi:general secretion pathway protein A